METDPYVPFCLWSQVQERERIRQEELEYLRQRLAIDQLPLVNWYQFWCFASFFSYTVFREKLASSIDFLDGLWSTSVHRTWKLSVLSILAFLCRITFRGVGKGCNGVSLSILVGDCSCPWRGVVLCTWLVVALIRKQIAQLLGSGLNLTQSYLQTAEFLYLESRPVSIIVKYYWSTLQGNPIT